MLKILMFSMILSSCDCVKTFIDPIHNPPSEYDPITIGCTPKSDIELALNERIIRLCGHNVTYNIWHSDFNKCITSAGTSGYVVQSSVKCNHQTFKPQLVEPKKEEKPKKYKKSTPQCQTCADNYRKCFEDVEESYENGIWKTIKPCTKNLNLCFKKNNCLKKGDSIE